MHCPALFKEERLSTLHDLIREYPLATLVTSVNNALIANLIPFSLHQGGQYGILRAHLARGNLQLESLREGSEALVIFQGPECYVTPSWYPSKAEHEKVVPTWNFTMVQARGMPQVFDDAPWIREQIEQLTNNQEQYRKDPWEVSDAPEDFVASQIKAIVGVEIRIASIEGKWKISQNRPPLDQHGVKEGLRDEQTCPGMLSTMEKQLS